MPELVTLGWQVAEWIELMLCHGPGDVQGDPVEFDPEFRAVLVRAYQLHPKSGRRLIDWYFLSRAKGRAKSELAGMIVCAEALGPVRFDHWAVKGETSWWGYEFEPGEPVGAPITYPFIRCLATEEGQAGNTYDNVVFMLTEGAVAGEFAGLDVGITRTFIPGGGEIRPCTAGAESKDGGKETFAVEDEPHLFFHPNEIRMHGTVARNLTKRKAAQPWMLSTSTMFLPGQRSVAEMAYDDHVGGRDTKGFFFDHREGGAVKRSDSNAKLKREFAAALGPAADWSDLEAKVRLARMPATEWSDVERYLCNRRPTLANVGWLKEFPGKWEACQSDLEIPLGAEVFGGLDFSLTRDSTSLNIAARVGERVVTRQFTWNPADGRIDHAEVMALIRQVGTLYDLVGCAYDPRLFELAAQLLLDEGYLMVEVPQSPERMEPACGHLQELIVGGELAHDGDPVLTAHVLRAERRLGTRGFTLAKGRSGHIDAAIALALSTDLLEHPPEKVYAPAGGSFGGAADDGDFFRPKERLKI